jgi:hypothetical protein
MNLTWENVTKIIAILSGTGITLATLTTIFIWLFKEWILNIFRKDLKKQENKLQEGLKQKELYWLNENKSLELRLGEEIRKSELQITKLINFEQKHYELLLSGYKETWGKLIDLGEYLIRDFPNHFKHINLSSGDINDIAYPIRERIHEVRRAYLFLPQETSNKVKETLYIFALDLNIFLHLTIELKNSAQKNEFGQQQVEGIALLQINEAINKMQTNLNSSIDKLKADFQEDYLKEVKNNNR